MRGCGGLESAGVAQLGVWEINGVRVKFGRSWARKSVGAILEA